MARQNYQHEKRQRDLAKKKKREEKLQRKAAARTQSDKPEDGSVPPGEETPAEE
jgi:hypothetical protein